MKISNKVEIIIYITMHLLSWGGSFAIIIGSMYIHNDSFWFALLAFALFWGWLLGGLYLKELVREKIEKFNTKSF